MKKLFTNKFNSYQNVVGILMDWRSVYEDIQILKDYSDEFMTLFESIKEQITKVDMEFKDVTGDKADAKKEMSRIASALASAAMVYATDIGDPELRSFLNFTKSDIRYARDAEAIEICRNIAEELNTHKEELVGYLITDEEISSLEGSIRQFDSLQIQREKVYSESVIETQRLEGLFERSDSLLNDRIDRLVRKMELTHGEFCNQYFQARRISDL